MEDNKNTPQPEPIPKKKINKRFLIILACLLVGGSVFGISRYRYSINHEETDDAQVEANIAPVIPRVPGYLATINVSDNKAVKAGDTLVTLDSRDMEIRLAQAMAGLAAAQSNVAVAKASTTASRAGVSTAAANVNTANAQIEAARVRVRRASQDFVRYSALIQDHSITQQQYEQAEAEKETAERQLQVLQGQRNAAQQQTNAVASQSQVSNEQISVAEANVKLREAEVESAKLSLSYCVITAAADGIVSKVNIQPGQLVQAGQSLFNIVLDNTVWIVANFKETQLAKMHIGQAVEVSIDAIPGGPIAAELASFSPATGAKFSLLPPDNATGNFVKVVQRVPVKITFKNADPKRLERVRAGMNATVTVNI